MKSFLPSAAHKKSVVMSSLVAGDYFTFAQRRVHKMPDELTRLPAMTTKDDLRALLPGQWKALTPAPATPTTGQ